jgi:hypothetical protein
MRGAARLGKVPGDNFTYLVMFFCLSCVLRERLLRRWERCRPTVCRQASKIRRWVDCFFRRPNAPELGEQGTARGQAYPSRLVVERPASRIAHRADWVACVLHFSSLRDGCMCGVVPNRVALARAEAQTNAFAKGAYFPALPFRRAPRKKKTTRGTVEAIASGTEHFFLEYSQEQPASRRPA